MIHQLGINATVFYEGILCGDHPFPEEMGCGHLHAIEHGPFELRSPGHDTFTGEGPALIFYKGPLTHQFNIPGNHEAGVVCADIHYQVGMENLLTRSLPPVLLVDLRNQPVLLATVELIRSQAKVTDSPLLGMVQNKLCEALLVQLIDYALAQGLLTASILKGLADAKLAPGVQAVLNQPGLQHTVEALARTASMSRAAFSAHFQSVVGVSAGQFLKESRIQYAMALLHQGKRIEWVAQAAGYSNQPAFSRAFKQQTGYYPSQWLQRNKDQTHGKHH